MQKIIVIGQPVNISVLGEPLEPLFERFYTDYFNGKDLPWGEIDLAARTYFDQHLADPVAHDDYFNNFISLWRHLLGQGNFVRAEFVWDRALKPALEWEQANSGQRLHKGTPYYFWAMTAIMGRDMDRGYLIAHRALEEDARTSGQPRPDTPGYALVSLNHEKPDQAFLAWVYHQAKHVENLLDAYNATHQRALTMDQVRQRFLTNPPTIEVLFLFTYTLARVLNVIDEPDHLRTNDFAGQLELNLLFDLTLVIDALIKAKNTTKRSFIDHAEHLLAVPAIHSIATNSASSTGALSRTLTPPSTRRAMAPSRSKPGHLIGSNVTLH